MSSSRFKTTYNVPGNYGSIEKATLYVEHDSSHDTIFFYDASGDLLFIVNDDCMENNIVDAIVRLNTPEMNKEGVESVSVDEWDKLMKNGR